MATDASRAGTTVANYDIKAISVSAEAAGAVNGLLDDAGRLCWAGYQLAELLSLLVMVTMQSVSEHVFFRST